MPWACSAGHTDNGVFARAAVFSQENSIQNFPCFSVSLFIYFNSLLLLFAWGNQWLPVSPRAELLPSRRGAEAEQTTRFVLPSLTFAGGNSESRAAVSLPVPLSHTILCFSLWIQKRRPKAFLTSARDCLVHTQEHQRKQQPSWKQAVLTPGCCVPLRMAALATGAAADLPCQERTIYRKGRLYFSSMAKSVPGPALTQCGSQELALGAAGRRLNGSH